MAALTIHIGNKNYSSWSLRAWLALKATGAAFDEILIPLYVPGSRDEILRHSPAGKVPILTEGRTTVWDSLAIGEYLAERFPEAGLWPPAPEARAQARAVSAEMHAGFGALRRHLPMNLRATVAGREIPAEVQAEIDRIAEIWGNCRRRFGAGGPYLFGRFTITDAMYAPVVSRFRTYQVSLAGAAQTYADAIWAYPAMQEWAAAARVEPMVLEQFEVASA
jgi:glutathione S-transferase